MIPYNKRQDAQIVKIKDYINGKGKYVTGEGTSITLENTIAAQFTKFDVEGNSVQDGTPSPDNEVPILSAGDNENLFDKDNVDWFRNNNSSFIDITNNSPSRIRTSSFAIEGGETYTVSGMPQGITFNTVRCYSEYGGNRTNEISRNPFTLPNTTKYIHLLFNGENLTDESITLMKNANIKLEQGTVATPYSPYGMGSITDKIVNRNLVEKNIKGYINISGFMSIDNASESFVFWAEQGKTYNYSCLKSTNRGRCAKSETINIVNGTPLTNIRNVSNSFTSNFTGWCVLFVNSSLDNEIKDSFMIEQGSTATDYIPHEEQTYTIPTQQPMRSIGDVRDKFVKVNGNWYERHYISRKVFDGTENWRYDGSNPRFILVTSDIFQYTDSSRHNSVLSNYYQAKTTGTNNIIFQYQTSILIYDTEYNSSTDYKSWLATKYANRTPLYIDYILENPLDLPCTEEQINVLENLPSTYKDFTIIQSQDETPVIINVEAVKKLL